MIIKKFSFKFCPSHTPSPNWVTHNKIKLSQGVWSTFSWIYRFDKRNISEIIQGEKMIFPFFCSSAVGKQWFPTTDFHSGAHTCESNLLDSPLPIVFTLSFLHTLNITYKLGVTLSLSIQQARHLLTSSVLIIAGKDKSWGMLTLSCLSNFKC